MPIWKACTYFHSRYSSFPGIIFNAGGYWVVSGIENYYNITLKTIYRWRHRSSILLRTLSFWTKIWKASLGFTATTISIPLTNLSRRLQNRSSTDFTPIPGFITSPSYSVNTYPLHLQASSCCRNKYTQNAWLSSLMTVLTPNYASIVKRFFGCKIHFQTSAALYIEQPRCVTEDTICA